MIVEVRIEITVITEERIGGEEVEETEFYDVPDCNTCLMCKLGHRKFLKPTRKGQFYSLS